MSAAPAATGTINAVKTAKPAYNFTMSPSQQVVMRLSPALAIETRRVGGKTYLKFECCNFATIYFKLYFAVA
jgi:hypothetical protein